MKDQFFLAQISMANQLAVSEIITCNDFTSKYCLKLSLAEAKELVETRKEALSDNGRIEFGGGIINKIIIEFCDSPYISQCNYTEVLNELVELFYFYKNEVLDTLSDDELIKHMKRFFDGPCQGSLELLKDKELQLLSYNVKNGILDFEDLQFLNYDFYNEPPQYDEDGNIISY